MFDVRLALYDRDKFIKVIPQAQDIQASILLNDTGAINFTIPTDVENSIPYSEILTWLDKYDLSLQWSDETGGWWEAPGCRFVFTHDSSNITAVRDQYSLSGVTTDFDLTGMLRLDTKKLNKEGHYVYKSSTPGNIIQTMLSNAQDHGLGTAITWDFDAVKDSTGATWPTKINMDIDPAITVRQILERLEDQGLIEWRMDGFKLQVCVPDKGMRNIKSCEFVVGREVDSGPQKRDRSHMANIALVSGDSGKTMIRTLATNARRGGRATSVSQAGVSDTVTMSILADATLATLATPSEQLTREFTVTENMMTFPFKHFIPGDVIWANGAGGDLEQLRVYQITISKTVGDGGFTSGNVVLADRYLENQIKQKRRIDALSTGTITGGGSSGNPVPAPRPALFIKPKAPTNLQVTADAYLTATRDPSAILYATWENVTQDINGATLDSTVRYEVGARAKSEMVWGGNIGLTVWPETTALTASHGDFYPDTVYRVAVRARTSDGVSDWSDMVEVTAPHDTTPPQPPSAPVLTTKLGTVTATWDGKDKNGTITWPVDFNGVVLYNDDTKVAELNNGVTSAVLGSFLAGSTASATLTAVDIWGNESDHSDASTIVVKSVLDDTSYASDMAGLKGDIENDYNGKIADAVGIANNAASSASAAKTDAADAQQKAKDAWTQSGLALSSANGKADIYHSKTTPPGTSHPDGSTWFVQASNDAGSDIVNTARWDASTHTWVTGLLGPNAVSALDLGKATVGQLDGQYIKAKTIKTEALQIGSVTSATLANNAITTVKIADGAITAGKITVDSALAKSIAAKLVTADVVNAGSITGAMLDADSINGKTITGATITGGTVQTVAAENRGVKITANGIKAYNFIGVNTLSIDGMNNSIVGDYHSNTPGNPQVAIVNVTSAGQPGVWFSPDGNTSGSTAAIYRDTFGNLNIRGDGNRANSILFQGFATAPGFYVHHDINPFTNPDGSFTCSSDGDSTMMVTNISDPKSRSTPAFGGMTTVSYNANCFVDNGNRLYKKSSSRDIKLDITDLDVDPEKILDIRPVKFHDRYAYEHPEAELPKGWVPGLIAEEVDDLGLGIFVPKDENGKVSGFDYERLWILLVPVIKKLKARVDELERLNNGNVA